MSNPLYENSKAIKAKLEADQTALGQRLNEVRTKLGGTISAGPISGLTPDAIKNHPEYRQIKMESDSNFKKLQNHNSYHVKTFANEYKAERMQRNKDRTK